ncbi:hypothetical protein RLEG3_13775 [Rhizobium leguminosarum bv. trifolii WSM1689]|uniref:hypothetical protein n=1 Tax=Rhizobium leguminosarum TaxID=384 RepID=UPI0003E0A60F|nr:hypothetical protein [Rhizobium leguminosarum]AHF86657.1 hypothetical protein RLEG3_13775 [Rhizobium leguminosarum bv. trifolii WSM1689]
MTNSVGRILLLLASSNTSREDLRTFSRWLHNEHPDELARRVQGIRSYADRDAAGPEKPVASQPQTSKLRDEVEELLVAKAGLRRVEAAALLREMMVQDGRIEPSFLPWNSGSFGQWLNKLAKASSQSDVLHFASRISRDRSSSNTSAWPLKSQN